MFFLTPLTGNIMTENLIIWLNILAQFATVLGIPIALLIFYVEKHRERVDREYGTYNALDEKYISFLETHLQWPDLEVYNPSLTDENWSSLSKTDQRRQQILFQILIFNTHGIN